MQRKPAARANRGEQATQRVDASRQVHEEVARVHEIECSSGQRRSEEIMPTYLDALAGKRLKQAGVQVNRQHRTRIADALS